MARASKSKGLTRREFVRAGALAAGAAAALPIGSAPSRAGAQAPAVGDAFWKQFSGTTLKVLMHDHPYPRGVWSRIGEFEKKTGIKVETDMLAWPVYLQRSDLELSAGAGAYDFVWVVFVLTSRWINAKWLAPLNPLMENPKITDKALLALDDFSPKLLGTFRKDGNLYALPILADVNAMMCRTDIMAKIGLSAPPDTFDELLAACKKVQSREVAGFVTRGNPPGLHWNYPVFLQGFGGNFFADPPKDMTPTLNTEAAIRSADFMATLIREYSPPGAANFDHPDWVALYQLGKVAFALEADTWLTTVLDKAKSQVADKIRVAPVPRGPVRRAPQLAVHGFGIPANARQKDPAWLLLQWATSQEMMSTVMEKQNYQGVTRTSVSGSKAYQDKFTIGGGSMGAIRQEAFETAQIAYRVVPEFVPIGDRVGIAIQQIATNQKTAKAAMDEAQKDVVEIVKRAGYKISA